MLATATDSPTGSPTGMPTSQPSAQYAMTLSAEGTIQTSATQYSSNTAFAHVLRQHPVACTGSNGDFINSINPMTPSSSTFAIQYSCAQAPPNVQISPSRYYNTTRRVCGLSLSQLAMHRVSCSPNPLLPSASFLTAVNVSTGDAGATCAIAFSCATVLNQNQNFICRSVKSGGIDGVSPVISSPKSIDALASQGLFCNADEVLQGFNLVNTSSNGIPPKGFLYGQGYFSYTCCKAVDKSFNARKGKSNILSAVPVPTALSAGSNLLPGQYLISLRGTSACVFDEVTGNFCCYTQKEPTAGSANIAYKYGCVLDDDTAADSSYNLTSGSMYQLVATSNCRLSVYNQTGFVVWSVGADPGHPASKGLTCAGAVCVWKYVHIVLADFFCTGNIYCLLQLSVPFGSVFHDFFCLSV